MVIYEAHAVAKEEEMETEGIVASSWLNMCATSLFPHMNHHQRAPLVYHSKQDVLASTHASSKSFQIELH